MKWNEKLRVSCSRFSQLTWASHSVTFPGIRLGLLEKLMRNNPIDIIIPRPHTGGKQREAGDIKISLLLCMSSRGPRINCIIVNEALMQLQERGPFFFLMRVTLVSVWTGVTESQNTLCSSARVSSNRLSLSVSSTSHSIIFYRLPTRRRRKTSSQVSRSFAFFFFFFLFLHRQVWRFYDGDCLFGWWRGGSCCSGGLFIIPLTHSLD